ncbi:uncharacterized protein B0I36DRAFT_431897 [Microdochium trichocladiopsis]|uniref:Uncharacterized protein n=1 Tax=Microdochium trichocladiopsis TaxID=1682393 RepID=A0A9P8Y6D6_9PEZI|nr:uncharacterized protein B0I36DRAFT_431897 [Microdochium trichocladiopsis]KAH7028986.1 hypothetical protein B0I36DRAFT_431897 [Microdochium trichocladiopsis]
MSMAQPAPLKKRLQFALRRSLSKFRHDGPPPVPPKDDKTPLPKKFPSYYSFKHSQPERDGRHYRQQSLTTYDVAAAAKEFPTPPKETKPTIGTEPPFLKLPSQDDQPLMPREELMVLKAEPVGVASSEPRNNERQMYRQQSNCIASVFDLDKELEQQQQQLEKQMQELNIGKQQPQQQSTGQETWDSDEAVGAGQDMDRTGNHGSLPVTPAATDEGVNKYTFPEATPSDTVDKAVVTATRSNRY